MHLQDLSADGGVPKEVVSDNGTNFVGAVNELKSLVSELDEEKILMVVQSSCSSSFQRN